MLPHDETVAHIAASVRAFHAANRPFRIFHGSSNTTRPLHDTAFIDISALSNILEIDAQSCTATVEPNVPMDSLVQATLAHGMVPPVVMEFPGITVGGGYAGSAGESSSFRWGLFSENVMAVEVVSGDGEIITASPTKNEDLFTGAAGAAGTLGVVTKLVLRLIRAKSYVEVTYKPCCSVEGTVAAVKEATQDLSNDYVDAIIFSPTHGVLMIGQLTDTIPPSSKAQTFSKPWDPWFYMHVQRKPRDRESVEWIPIAAYLFRYDRGGFWVGKTAFEYIGFVPFTRFTRWLLDDILHTRSLFRALHATHMSFWTMVHDLALPYDTVSAFIDYTAQNLGIWPMWLCPLRATEPPTFHPCATDANGNAVPTLNVGVWGTAKGSGDIHTFVRQNRELEAKLKELGGRKALYSHTYYTEDEFWQVYGKEWYEKLRKRYKATTLPSVYEKVRVNVEQEVEMQRLPQYRRLGTVWPFAIFSAVWCAVKSGDYRLHRQLGWMLEEPGKKK